MSLIRLYTQTRTSTHSLVCPGDVKVKLKWLENDQSLASVVKLATDEHPGPKDMWGGRGRWGERRGRHNMRKGLDDKLSNSMSSSRPTNIQWKSSVNTWYIVRSI